MYTFVNMYIWIRALSRFFFRVVESSFTITVYGHPGIPIVDMCWYSLYVYKYTYRHKHIFRVYTYIPARKLCAIGFSTPFTPFRLICTTSSELRCTSHLYQFEWAGVDIRWFSVDGFDTRWIPSSLSCGMDRYIYEHETPFFFSPFPCVERSFTTTVYGHPGIPLVDMSTSGTTAPRWTSECIAMSCSVLRPQCVATKGRASLFSTCPRTVHLRRGEPNCGLQERKKKWDGERDLEEERASMLERERKNGKKTQGGEDTSGTWCLQVLFCKRPQSLVAKMQKGTSMSRLFMGLCHPEVFCLELFTSVHRLFSAKDRHH